MGGIRALVADDEPIIRNIVRRYLRRFGCEAHEVASVPEAREVLEREADTFGLVVTDHRMPGGTGHELIDWIRMRWASLPIILMSGGFSEPLPPGALVRTLEKPFSGDTFADVIRELLGPSEHGAIARPAECSGPGAWRLV